MAPGELTPDHLDKCIILGTEFVSPNHVISPMLTSFITMRGSLQQHHQNMSATEELIITDNRGRSEGYRFSDSPPFGDIRDSTIRKILLRKNRSCIFSLTVTLLLHVILSLLAYANDRSIILGIMEKLLPMAMRLPARRTLLRQLNSR